MLVFLKVHFQQALVFLDIYHQEDEKQWVAVFLELYS
jgi:hypothetical protein